MSMRFFLPTAAAWENPGGSPSSTSLLHRNSLSAAVAPRGIPKIYSVVIVDVGSAVHRVQIPGYGQQRFQSNLFGLRTFVSNPSRRGRFDTFRPSLVPWLGGAWLASLGPVAVRFRAPLHPSCVAIAARWCTYFEWIEWNGCSIWVRIVSYRTTFSFPFSCRFHLSPPSLVSTFGQGAGHLPCLGHPRNGGGGANCDRWNAEGRRSTTPRAVGGRWTHTTTQSKRPLLVEEEMQCPVGGLLAPLGRPLSNSPDPKEKTNQGTGTIHREDEPRTRGWIHAPRPDFKSELPTHEPLGGGTNGYLGQWTGRPHVHPNRASHTGRNA